MTITATHRHALKVITQLWPNLRGGGYGRELNEAGGSDILSVRIVKNGAGHKHDHHTVMISVISSSFPEDVARRDRVEFRGVETCLEVEIAFEWSPQLGKYYHCVIFTKAGTEVLDIPTKAKRLDARRVACRAVNLLIGRLTERWIAEPQPEPQPEPKPEPESEVWVEECARCGEVKPAAKFQRGVCSECCKVASPWNSTEPEPKIEHWCPYCGDFIFSNVHRPDFHNSSDDPDELTSDKVRVDGVVFDCLESFEAEQLKGSKLKAYTELCERVVTPLKGQG